jgi:hypothetical protein
VFWGSVTRLLVFLMAASIALTCGDSAVVSKGGWVTVLVLVATIIWKVAIAVSRKGNDPKANLMHCLHQWFNPDYTNQAPLGMVLVILSLSLIPVIIKRGQPNILLVMAFLPTLTVVSEALYLKFHLCKAHNSMLGWQRHQE